MANVVNAANVVDEVSRYNATKVAYYLDIPIDNWDLYFKHIVRGIYGVKEGEYYTRFEEGGIRRIEFEVNPTIPLINSLPRTIHNQSQSPHYENINKMLEVEIAIKTAIKDFLRPGGTYYPNTKMVLLTTEELYSIVLELGRIHKINKFAFLSQNRFLVYIHPYPVIIILKVVHGVLVVTIYADVVRSLFDVDDGYSGILRDMNPMWEQWKEDGDITAPIQPPNYV